MGAESNENHKMYSQVYETKLLKTNAFKDKHLGPNFFK